MITKQGISNTRCEIRVGDDAAYSLADDMPLPSWIEDMMDEFDINDDFASSVDSSSQAAIDAWSTKITRVTFVEKNALGIQTRENIRSLDLVSGDSYTFTNTVANNLDHS